MHSVQEVTVARMVQQCADPQCAPQLLDVREVWEWSTGHLPSALHLPLGQVENQVESLLPDHTKPVIVYCEHGVRSARGALILQQLGYTQVFSLAGGMAAWRKEHSAVVG